MYSDEQIIKCHGQESLEHLNHKNIGGRNSSRGNRYEDKFALHELAAAAVRYYQNGEVRKFFTQVRAYVDDLIVNEGNFWTHYQIKDVIKLAWSKGKNSLKDNFQKQVEINKFINNAAITQTNIVVSSKILHKSLECTIPPSLKRNSGVVWFPNLNVEHYSDLPSIKIGLDVLSSTKKPMPSDRINLLIYVFGCWCNCKSDEGISMIEFINILRQHKNCYVRLAPYVVDDELKNVLFSIPGFNFDTERGYFNWSFSVTDEGHLQYPCESQKFVEFRERVMNANPKDFDSLEVFLL